MDAGRPSIFTAALGHEICTRIAGGETLTAICREPEMPCRATVSSWLSQPGPTDLLRDFLDAYVQARAGMAEGEFDEIRELADGTHGEASAAADEAIENMDPETRAARKIWRHRYYEALNATKVQIDARKFRVARMNASKYGDKAQVQVSTPPGKPIEIEVTPNAERIADVLKVLADAGVLPMPGGDDG